MQEKFIFVPFVVLVCRAMYVVQKNIRKHGIVICFCCCL